MKNIAAAIAMSIASVTAVSASPVFEVSKEVSHPSLCLNVINPVTNQYLRQAEIDTTKMMEYLGAKGFKEVSKKRGPCQTTYTSKTEGALVMFVFSTLSGEFVGLDATKSNADFELPKIDGIKF
jgi:hypothetical protein